ncbi:vomeronasal type-1 receptor 1-like [Sarcophilus harrisii]
MIPMDIFLSIVFLAQTGIGIQGNLFLLYLFSFLFFTGQRLRPIDLILSQLTLANSLVLLSKGFLQGLVTLGVKIFLDDIGCKIIFYLHRVGRGLSLSITCLLSGLQAIIISPQNSRFIKFKIRILKYIIPSILFCWIFSVLQNIILLEKLKGPRSTRNTSETKEFWLCSVTVTPISVPLHAIVFSLPDAVCMTFISFTSGYKVYLLYEHHKRVQQFHSDRFLPRASPETRATQMILLLVSTFVTFYLLNSILAARMHLRTPRPWLLHSSAFLASCFPMVSPFVLISSDSQILKYYRAVHGRKSPHNEPDYSNTQSLISFQALVKQKNSLNDLKPEVSKQIQNPHVAI